MCVGEPAPMSALHFHSGVGRGCSSSVVSGKARPCWPRIGMPRTHIRLATLALSRKCHRPGGPESTTTVRLGAVDGPGSIPATRTQCPLGSMCPRRCPLPDMRRCCLLALHRARSCSVRRRHVGELSPCRRISRQSFQRTQFRVGRRRCAGREAASRKQTHGSACTKRSDTEAGGKGP